MEALGAYVRLYNALKIKGPVSWRIEVYKESYQISMTLEAKHHTIPGTLPAQASNCCSGGVAVAEGAVAQKESPSS